MHLWHVWKHQHFSGLQCSASGILSAHLPCTHKHAQEPLQQLSCDQHTQPCFAARLLINGCKCSLWHQSQSHTMVVHTKGGLCPTEVEKDECRCDTSNANGFMRWQASFQLKSLEEKPSRPSPKPATQVKLQTKKWDKLGGPKTIAQGNGYRCWRHYLILTTHVTLFCFLKGGRRVLGSFFPFAICFFLTKII